MKKLLLILIYISSSVSSFGQNENPFSQFGYQAPIVPGTSKSSIPNSFCLINTDTSSTVSRLVIDPSKRLMVVFHRDGDVLQFDSVNSYSMARWLSPDPYGQFTSPYVGMGNNPIMSVDPDGGFNVGATVVGAVVGFAAGSLVGLAVDSDNWWKYGLAGAAAGALGGAMSGDIGISERATFLEKTEAEIRVALTGKDGILYKDFKNGVAQRVFSYGPGTTTKTIFKNVLWEDADAWWGAAQASARGLNHIKGEKTLIGETTHPSRIEVKDQNGKVVGGYTPNWGPHTSRGGDLSPAKQKFEVPN